MKRNTPSATNSPKKKTKANPDSSSESDYSSGEDMSPLPTTNTQPGTAEDQANSDVTMYTCETRNRFAILPIQPTLNPVLRPAKKPIELQDPPKIFVPDTKPNVQKLLAKFKNFMLQNVSDGTNVLPANIQDHSAMLELLKNTQYFTRGLPGEGQKRFVVYGLGSADLNNIKPELAKYGINAEKILQKFPQRPRYHDHCNYIVYIKSSDNVTLDMIKQARYLCHTVVTWANFIVNGDGVTKCGRCQRFNHSKDHCNMDPRCGVCGGYHLTYNCELLAEKRAQNKTKIDPRLLKCVHCNKNHTSGYTECEQRLEFIKARDKRNRRWINAPAPASNPWQSRQHHPPIQSNNLQSNNQQVIPPMPIIPLNFVNNSFKQQPPQQPLPTHNNTDSEKFTAQEIASIFNHILDCVDKCTNKRDQLRILTNVVAQYYI